MTFRPYDHDRDRAAVHRIWHECGWIDKGEEAMMDRWVESCVANVAEINGEAECLVLTVPGTMRHLETDLKLSCVAGVTTSLVARRQRLAGRLTARAVADDVAAGAQVAALGMFEQGFYDRLGFGTGPYEHLVAFDPSDLRRDALPEARVPVRITLDDWEAVHQTRIARHRGHGACNLDAAAITRGDMEECKTAFGLGYRDGSELTHLVWFEARGDVEVGPFKVAFTAWRTSEQLLELLSLIHGLGDQVRTVTMREPAGLQLQDLMRRPFHQKIITAKGGHENQVRAVAYWQVRICDVPGCLRQTHLPSGDLRFNLALTDPIAKLLDDADTSWRGVAGDYVITLGRDSDAVPGRDDTLPTLKASINAFSRMWFGVGPASGLAVTDDLSGPPELLRQLDEVLRLPSPHPDWNF